MTDDTAASGRRPLVVVGVDGSPGSRTALDWAIAYAGRVGSRLDVIATWQDPSATGYARGWMPGEDADWAAITQTYVDQEVKDAVSHSHTDVDVHAVVVQGNPARVLLDVSAHADLLVVGSRGHGTLAGMLLASVSQHVVQHAGCPVVVVPVQREPEQEV